MLTNFFGTDGIRGKVGEYPISADFFLKLGWAVGSVLMKNNDQASVVIGKDTRISGYMFESALEAGFLSAGVNVGLLGPMPTPAVAYLTKEYDATAGVVISASHNHFKDNGVKFFSANGLKLDSKAQQEIEKKILEPLISVGSDKIGKAQRHEQALESYIAFCKKSFNNKINLNNLSIVIDCANGATYHIAKKVFSGLGSKLKIINDKPDGFNINYECGATSTKRLQKTVLQNNLSLGIAFDGDGDRVIMVDHKGEIVDGDELIFIIAKAWKSQNRLTNNSVVGTKMSNLGMRHSLKNLDIKFIEADVGDRYVLEKMEDNNIMLGGEPSGHIICRDKTTSGDGIIAALQILEILYESNCSLNELKQEMKKYPQIIENIKTKNKIDLINHKELKECQLQIEKLLGDEGRTLIRTSGTEALIRVMVEGKNLSLVETSAKKLVNILKED